MGFLFAFLASIVATSKDLVSKKLAFSVSGGISAFGSFLFALPYYAVLLTVLYLSGLENFEVTAGFFGFIVLRALADCLAEWTKMTALTKGDIGLVVCFFALSPAFLLITSPLLTNDVLPPLGILAVLIIVAGSMLLMPRRDAAGGSLPFASQKSAIIWATAAAFFFSLNNCFDRLAVLTASAPLSAFAVTLLPVAFLAPFQLRRKTGAAFREHFSFFALRGGFETGYMVLKLLALQHMQAPYVTGLQKISLIFSILGGRFFYNEQETVRRLLAGGVIMIGVVLIIIAEYF